MPFARGELATAVAYAGPCPAPPCPELERLYVVGGLSGIGTTEDAVVIYDPHSRQWNAGPRLPEPRHHLAAASIGDSVYVSGGAGGAAPPWEPEATCWALKAGAEAWEVVPSMPEPRLGHRMVAHDGQLYVIGGKGPSSRVLIYAPGEGWRTGAAMPVPRDHLSVVVVDGRIWAIGGRAPHSLMRVDVYDPERDRWDPGPDLPAATSGAAEAAIDGIILIFGGEDPGLFGGQVYDRHWMIDARAPKPAWRPAPAPPLAVHGADGALFQGTLVVAGGASRHGALSVTAWSDALQRLDSMTLGR